MKRLHYGLLAWLTLIMAVTCAAKEPAKADSKKQTKAGGMPTALSAIGAVESED